MGPDHQFRYLRRTNCRVRCWTSSIAQEWAGPNERSSPGALRGVLHHHRAQRARGVTHHYAKVNGTELHYVAAGTEGPPVLLVHGFPETWWTFRKLIPLLAATHRVYAVDLRGFGDSDNGSGAYDSKTSAEDLHLLIEELNVGPVHLTGQDISGATVLRLAATHPEDVRSFTAIEMGLPGFGLEMLADVTHWGYLAHRRSCHPRDPRDAPRRSRARVPRSVRLSGHERHPRSESPTPTSTSSSVPTPVPTAGAARSASASPCSKKATRSQPLSPATS